MKKGHISYFLLATVLTRSDPKFKKVIDSARNNIQVIAEFVFCARLEITKFFYYNLWNKKKR